MASIFNSRDTAQIDTRPEVIAKFGNGLVVPFRRGPSDFVAAAGVERWRSAVAVVLGTESDSGVSQGEVPWDTSFGSRLHLLRHKNNTPALAEMARIYATEALSRWLPEIRLKYVDTFKMKDEDGNESILVIRITYDIVLGKSNEVVAADVDQEVAIAA